MDVVQDGEVRFGFLYVLDHVGRIMTGEATIDTLGSEIYDFLYRVAGGEATKPESLGHRASILTHISFEPTGRACLPA